MAGGWESLGLLDELVEAVTSEDYGWFLPTAIQDEAIPLILGGGDVMASAETGSGKTAAFALPILQLCVETKEKERDTTKASESRVIDPGGHGGGTTNSKQQQQSSVLQSAKSRIGDTTTTTSKEFFRMSYQDRQSSVAMDPNNPNHVQSRHVSQWAGIRCNAGISLIPPPPGAAKSAKHAKVSANNKNHKNIRWTWHVKVLDEGVVRVGWSTADASLQLGLDKEGYGYGGTGFKGHEGAFQEYPSEESKVSFGKDDIISCHLEFVDSPVDDGETAKDAKTTTTTTTTLTTTEVILSFGKNGTWLGEAFTLSSNTAKLVGALYPTACLKNAECEIYFTDEQQLPVASGDKNELYQPLAAIVDTHLYKVNPRDSSSYQQEQSLPMGNSADKRNSGAKKQQSSSASQHRHGPLALVIEPTRDLAEQTFRVFDNLAQRLNHNASTSSSLPPIHAALLVGGISPKDTVQKLDRGQVDILVGTPPIMASYVKKGTIACGHCHFFVLDEADELISTDSLLSINAIYARLVAARHGHSAFDRLQVCFFSATLHSPAVRELANNICHRPLWIDLRGQNESILPDTVHHCIIPLQPSMLPDDTVDMVTSDAVHREGKLKEPIDLSVLKDKDLDSEKIKQLKFRAILEVIDKFAMEQVLIFCRTNLDCDLMEQHLTKAGGGAAALVNRYKCGVLAGMRSMEERQKNLQQFKDGTLRILVATDVAARGIDIQELPFVINMTLPDEVQTYVHRIGRVGRAERMGLAISLVSTVEERVWFCQNKQKPPCSNTRDYEKGGNCIWYNEPAALKEIEKLLAQNNVTMSTLNYPGLELPHEIKSILESGGYGSEAGAGGTVNPELEFHMKGLKERVKQAESTDFALQSDYWTIRSLFKKQ